MNAGLGWNDRRSLARGVDDVVLVVSSGLQGHVLGRRARCVIEGRVTVGQGAILAEGMRMVDGLAPLKGRRAGPRRFGDEGFWRGSVSGSRSWADEWCYWPFYRTWRRSWDFSATAGCSLGFRE